MEIVPFRKEDQEATAAFMRQIYQEMGWPEQPKDRIDDLSSFFHLPNDGYLLLIKEHGKVVGMGGYINLINGDLLLKRFYIDKELRGSGIAQKLWEKLLESMKPLQASRVVLDVSKRNPRAIRFYEKNGFVQYDQAPIDNWEESNHPETQRFYFLNI